MPNWHYATDHNHIAEVESTEEQYVRKLTQLVMGIGSPTTLPISLPVALSVVVVGSDVEAAKVRPGTRIVMPSVIELLRTLAAIKTAPISTKLGNRLTVRDKC